MGCRFVDPHGSDPTSSLPQTSSRTTRSNCTTGPVHTDRTDTPNLGPSTKFRPVRGLNGARIPQGFVRIGPQTHRKKHSRKGGPDFGELSRAAAAKPALSHPTNFYRRVAESRTAISVTAVGPNRGN